MQDGKIEILIADDHFILRQGLRRILEAEPDMIVVSEASTGNEAFKKAQEFKPELVIMDVSMPEQNGIEAMRQILQIPNTRIRILILSMHLEYEVVIAAMSAGAAGYLVKDALDTELIAAVRSVVRGGTVLSSSVSRILVDTPRNQEPVSRSMEMLTAREREVFLQLAEGKTPTEVAAALFVSPKTVHTHRQHINEKLGIRTTTQLIRFALREGLIKMG